MIPHHQQALEMAGMALEKATRPEVKALAQKITEAQKPEIETIQSWLKQWGEAMDDMAGDHSGMGGMMSTADMEALKAATGADFDRLFLEQMIKHHEGAITMAKTEIEAGRYGPAQDLARRIVEAQQAEIEEMHQLSGS
jgi:uncharacterized protein (DUF305 family)